MAHNLSTTGDRASMMYVGERPWHGLGTRLDGPATAREAITAAGLDWRVVERPVYDDYGNSFRGIDGYKALIREDSTVALSIVGEKYTPIQNTEAFGFFDAVVGGGQAIYHTAGAIGRGERVWILAQIPGDLRVGKTDDLIEKFLLLHTSHDGTASLRMGYTPVRVVCQNTLTQALGGLGRDISIRHTENALTRVGEAQKALGFAVRYYDDLAAVVNRLAGVQIGQHELSKYFTTLVPDNEKSENKSRTQNIRATLETKFISGRGQQMAGVRGTWWAAYNAVSEYTDHERSTRGDTDSERASNRLSSIWWGSAAALKGRAFDLAMKGVGLN